MKDLVSVCSLQKPCITLASCLFDQKLEPDWEWRVSYFPGFFIDKKSVKIRFAVVLRSTHGKLEFFKSSLDSGDVYTAKYNSRVGRLSRTILNFVYLFKN